MKVDRNTAVKNLPKKGFRSEPGKDHIFFHHEFKGKETGSWTKISHSKKHKDIDGGLITAMRKQLNLEKNQQVYDLCTCPMSKEEYEQFLIQKGFFSPEEVEP